MTLLWGQLVQIWDEARIYKPKLKTVRNKVGISTPYLVLVDRRSSVDGWTNGSDQGVFDDRS